MEETLYKKMKYCKLSGMIEAFNRVHDEAQLEELNYLEFINKLLDEEVINRENNRFKRLIINANLKLSHFRWKRSSESEPLEIFPVTI